MDKSLFERNYNISYQSDKNLPIAQIQALYKSINWKDKDEEIIMEYLQKSLVVVSAWDGELLIGIARATAATLNEINIWDVAVRPSHQKQGIGSRIMKCMLTILDDLGVPVVTLYAEPGKEKFYTKFGFLQHQTRLLAMTRKI